MTKSKSTKRALLSSVLALVVCVAMLVGSTFAWFTDNASTAGNTIVSGTLDIGLVDAADNSMEGEVIDFVTVDNRTQSEIFWEPGCTYKTEPVYVVNKGNLALKYKVGINGIDGDAKLLEVIEWTVKIGDTEYALSALEGKLYPAGSNKGASKSDAIVLSGHMKEEAGNEYQGLTVEGISVTVFATQLTSESDSFSDQYDAMATVDDINELKASLAADYDLITLGADITLNETLTIPSGKTVAIDLAGYAIQQTKECTDSYSMISNSGNLTILDSVGTGRITLNDTGANSGSSWGAYTIRNDGTLIVENGTIENIAPNSTSNVNNAIFSYAGSTTIKGGTFNVPYSRSVRQWNGTLTIEGGTFDGQVWVQAMSDVTTTISGGSFKPATNGNDGSSVFVTNNTHDVALSVTGGTFATKLGMTVPEKCVTGGTFGVDPSGYVAIGYKAVPEGNRYKVIKYATVASTVAEMEKALKNGDNVVLANDIIISESLPITKDTVLDLNGKNIGTSGSTTGSPLYLQGGKLTVKNGTLDLDGLHTNVNGTFSVAIGYDAQTELVVENVNFTGKTAINGTFATDGPLKISISDCTMDVTSVGIAVSANSTEAVATITNCNIDADEYAIFASQGSKITINGGTYKSAGKVITSMYNNTVVTINGGTFDGELWVTGGGSLVIYGGTFTADPTAYVADGYQAVDNANGTWTVTPL